MGIPVSLFLGLMLAFHFRNKEKSDILSNGNSAASLGSGFKGEFMSSSDDYPSGDDSEDERFHSKGETPKEKKVNLIAKGAERFVFQTVSRRSRIRFTIPALYVKKSSRI